MLLHQKAWPNASTRAVFGGKKMKRAQTAECFSGLYQEAGPISYRDSKSQRVHHKNLAKSVNLSHAMGRRNKHAKARGIGRFAAWQSLDD